MGGLIAESIGCLLAAYLVLRLVAYIFRKVRRRPNHSTHIAICGLLTASILVTLASYGYMDGRDSPQYVTAFLMYFGPSMLATVIELVRTTRHLQHHGASP